MELPGLKLRGSLELCLLYEVQWVCGALASAVRVPNASLLCVHRALTLGGGLPHLEHLNLSGCLTVTGAGLQELVSACPSLKDEHFYYCDNINGNVFL